MLSSVVACDSIAEDLGRAFGDRSAISKKKDTGYDVFNFFGTRLSSVMPETQVVDMDAIGSHGWPFSKQDSVVSKSNTVEQANNANSSGANSDDEVDPYGLLKDSGNVFFGNSLNQILDPDKTPRVRVNPEAPGPFIGMALAHQQGKRELATRYAGQYVRYLVDLMYEVSDLTSYVMDALVKEKMADDNDVAGVGQYLDMEFARTRDANHYVVRPTHEHAMRRVKPDPKHEAYVYFFFSLSCNYCRDMAPDIERLWRVAKGDSRLKMAALVLGDAPDAWIQSYREYTGLTIPIVPGGEVAKAFRIKFLPAMVIMSPNTKTSYMKTGLVGFDRMYELLMTAQGLSVKMTPDVYKLAYQTVIGEAEKLGKSKKVSGKPVVGSGKTELRGGIANASAILSVINSDKTQSRNEGRGRLGKL